MWFYWQWLKDVTQEWLRVTVHSLANPEQLTLCQLTSYIPRRHILFPQWYGRHAPGEYKDEELWSSQCSQHDWDQPGRWGVPSDRHALHGQWQPPHIPQKGATKPDSRWIGTWRTSQSWYNAVESYYWPYSGSCILTLSVLCMYKHVACNYVSSEVWALYMWRVTPLALYTYLQCPYEGIIALGAYTAYDYCTRCLHCSVLIVLSCYWYCNVEDTPLIHACIKHRQATTHVFKTSRRWTDTHTHTYKHTSKCWNVDFVSRHWWVEGTFYS